MPSTTPSSILIIGSGVFGLATAYELCQDKRFENSKITLVDRSPVPNPYGSSIDTSRIIRADYASTPYATLAAAAQEHWRSSDWGADQRYHESGFILSANQGREAYVTQSLENVRAIEASAREQGKQAMTGPADVLSTHEGLKAAMRTAGITGDTGYINHGSGWADSEACMIFLREKVEALNRVTFITDSVSRLIFSPDNNLVTGVLLASNKTLTTDLTILAAGAWTPSLLDMRGIATATGQVLGYIRLTPAQLEKYKGLPVIMNLSTGLFSIGPDNHGILKLAQHAYGYANPVSIKHPEPHKSSPFFSEHNITVSIPALTNDLPKEALRTLQDFQAQLFPDLPLRPYDQTRICWYTDTASGDWIIDFHPSYGKSLLVVTGGSGHAFKFLPIIGEKIVQRMTGALEEEYAELWKWPEHKQEDLWTGDGSRGGIKGLVLHKAMGKGAAKL